MRSKVELHSDVVWFVRHRCTEREKGKFYAVLEAVRNEPIANSEAIIDPRIRPHVLRSFRFGTNIAVFEWDPAKNRIRVLECRKSRPRQREQGGGEVGGTE